MNNYGNRESPGPVVKTWAFTVVDLCLITGQGTEIPQAMQCCKKKNYGSKLNFLLQISLSNRVEGNEKSIAILSC